MEKESWDNSHEKAKTLKTEDFGTAEEALESIITENGTVKRSAVKMRSKSGVSAFLRRSSIGKLVSGVQEKGLPKDALWQAAANIDKLFANAMEPWRFALNPGKNNDGLKDRRILYAPMEYLGRLVPVKITVKEYLDPLAAAKLYSIEAIDFDL